MLGINIPKCLGRREKMKKAKLLTLALVIQVLKKYVLFTKNTFHICPLASSGWKLLRM